MTTIASFFLALYAVYYFQKGFEMVPYVSKVEDLAAQWLLVCARWLLCISLYPWTLTRSREAHSSTWPRGSDFINAQCLHSRIITYQLILLKCFCSVQMPQPKVEMKLCVSSTKRSAAISEYLKKVELKCEVVDDSVLKVLKFLSTYNICKLTGNAPCASIFLTFTITFISVKESML